MVTQNPTVNELLDQLPENFKADAPPPMDLAGLLARAQGTSVPIGRLSRFWTLGTLQGKIAAAYAFWWLRGMWGDADDRQRQLNETHLAAAVHLLGTMSHLRGAVMKVGQLLAHWPGIAPDEFAAVLGRLHFEAPPMHFSLLRESVRAELGADPEDLFEEFEPQACAAASLGQVHRARLKGSGRLVAVKVQYPGIARSLTSDIANLRLLMMPMRFGDDGQNILAQLEDIEAMLALDVDYGAEAQNMRQAAATLSGLEGVYVPCVHEKLSTGRVLTMDWVEGRHVGAFMKSGASQAECDRLGELLARAFMRMCYRAHMLYCDLHPGNYVFMPDGRLGLIDFGCARRYSAEEVEYLTIAERAGFESPQAVRAALARGADLTARQQAERERMELMVAWYDWMCEPTRTTAVFDFSREEYLLRGMEIWRRLVRGRYVRSLPVNTWIAKSFIGLRAMLLHLRARVALGRVLREETSVRLPTAD